MSKLVARTLCTLLLLSALVAGPAAAAESREYIVTLSSEKSIPNGFESWVAHNGGRIVRTMPQIGTAIVSSANPKFAAQLALDAMVAGVSKDQSYQVRPLGGTAEPIVLQRPPGRNAAVGRIGVAATAEDMLNAPLYSFQWNLPLIKAPQAWARGHLGRPEVVVAVVESGIDYTHPELVGKVDLERSISFVAADDALIATRYPGLAIHPSVDLNLGGTLVAGLIACNGVGTACVAPNVTLVSVKAVDNLSVGTHAAIISGIYYAASIRADVIACTFGGHIHPTDFNFQAVRSAYRRAIDFAEAQGSVIVAGIGERPIISGFDADAVLDVVHFPPAQFSKKVIGVSSTSPNRRTNFDALAPYSNFGNALVSISAPGGRLDTGSSRDRLAGPCTSFSQVFTTCQRTDPAEEYDHVLWPANNSSMAQVAGLAALIKSAHPDFTPAQVRRWIFAGAVDIGAPGKDPLFGHGRLNVVRSLVPRLR
jgi:lantibiotic leader peptide-processing serine protease